MKRLSLLTALLIIFTLSVSSCVPFTVINGDSQEEDVNGGEDNNGGDNNSGDNNGGNNNGGDNTGDENNGDDPSGETPELGDNTLVKVLFDEIDGDVTNPERGFYYRTTSSLQVLHCPPAK